MKNNYGKTNIYHNTELLLKNYRDVVWSLEVAVYHAEKNIVKEYGKGIDEFLNMVYEAGVELTGIKIENQVRTINRSRNMLRIIDNAAELLRNRHKTGELYYWILYYSYLSPQEIGSTDEIIEKLKPYMKDISKRTFFRRKQDAVYQIGVLLWGYTTKDCQEFIEYFEKNN